MNILDEIILTGFFSRMAQNPRLRGQKQTKRPVATSLKMAKEHFESKHPVSLLGELSAKRKLGVPQYELVLQEGPSHQRQFLFKVQFGSFYINKKQKYSAYVLF